MNHELTIESARFIVWVDRGAEGWKISATTNDWDVATDSWLIAQRNANGRQVIITELCNLRVEREHHKEPLPWP